VRADPVSAFGGIVAFNRCPPPRRSPSASAVLVGMAPCIPLLCVRVPAAQVRGSQLAAAHCMLLHDPLNAQARYTA
jgi:hypothetical protein